MLGTEPVFTTGTRSLSGSNPDSFAIHLLIANTPTEAITRVWPSGLALATYAAPRLPPAPGLFSMTTACPSASVSLGVRVRTMMSLVPPGR